MPYLHGCVFICSYFLLTHASDVWSSCKLSHSMLNTHWLRSHLTRRFERSFDSTQLQDATNKLLNLSQWPNRITWTHAPATSRSPEGVLTHKLLYAFWPHLFTVMVILIRIFIYAESALNWLFQIETRYNNERNEYNAIHVCHWVK